MDLMVLAAQRWVNETYKGKKGYEVVEETGKTGWPTMRSLIRALQIEEGIGEPNGSFGPTTTKLCPTVSASTKNQNLIKIVQSALYCKGYNPSAISGNYGPNTQEAVFKLQSDAGLPITDGVVTPMIFKALLSMDAYVLLSKGDPKIRTIQRGLNNKYYKTIGVMPCDGIYSRGTNTALIYGLQIEEGIAGANGHFGPGTSSHCPVLKQGDNSRFVTILKYALYCNNQDAQSFTTSFDASTKSAVYEFQKFSGLNATGVADLQTWKSLLISTGDPSRKGKACDCATRLTPAKAKSIKAAGYDIVGRYLANVPGGLDKKLTSSELSTIFAAGLSVFPIFQLAANKRDYFTSARGTSDARQAIQAALEFGFPKNTIIYFAVDFDAMDYDVDVAILKYFEAVKAEFDKNNARHYKIGIYAPRNVCSRVSNAGYACTSFVCDMSTGFSGNLGYPLPKNWAFDQISTIKVGSGDGSIEIDNNICSGRDNGVSKFEPNSFKEFAKNIFSIFGVEESNADLGFKQKRPTSIPSPGVLALELKPKITAGGRDILKKETDVLNGKIETSNIIDDLLAKAFTQENTTWKINAIKKNIGTIIGEGKIATSITYDSELKCGYKIEAEQTLAEIDDIVTQSVCASVAFFPEKENENLEKIFNEIKVRFTEYVAGIIITAAIIAILAAPEISIGAILGSLVSIASSIPGALIPGMSIPII